MFIKHAHHTKTVYKILEKPPEQGSPVVADQIKMAQPQQVGPKAVKNEHGDEIVHHHVHVGHVNHGHSHELHSRQNRNRGHGRYHGGKHVGHAHHHSGKHRGGNKHGGRTPKRNRGHDKQQSEYKHGKDDPGKSHRGDYSRENEHQGGHEPGVAHRDHTKPGYKTAGHGFQDYDGARYRHTSKGGHKRGGDFRDGYQVVEPEDTVDDENFDNLLSTMPENMKSFLSSPQTAADLQGGMSSVTAVSSTPATVSKDVYYTLDPELPYDVTRTSRQREKKNKFDRNTME
ncbi:histidine-rich glycoprotein-like [Adelges cooleyi]|uniref:histidine-rich glycoprotein-like n=1 Tax=Adelges cooleyi TaxID=133065 RepID=UPI00217F99C8|nr:histidine-rich glycoprotein-like [Adelges cooleyi]